MLKICDINDVKNIKLGQHTTHKSLKRGSGLQIRVRLGKLFSLFLIQNNLLWVLKRTVSMRRFF